MDKSANNIDLQGRLRCPAEERRIRKVRAQLPKNFNPLKT